MPTKQDLIGLGMVWKMADVLGVTPLLKAIAGAAAGSATQIGGTDYLFVPTSGTSACKLPPVGGDTGTFLGSPTAIANYTSAAIVVFAANNALGSAVTILANGTSAAGTTGMSLLSGHTMLLWPVTVSTWMGIKTSV